MNLVQNISTMILGMHDQLTCQCFAITLGMEKGKFATDEEILTMQRTLNVIKSLRKELEIVSAGMLLTVEPQSQKVATPAPSQQSKTTNPTQAATQSAKAENVSGSTATKGTAPAFLAPEPQINPAHFTPEMAAVMNGSNKPLMRGITGLAEPRTRMPVRHR
jgi:hypothetical protein